MKYVPDLTRFPLIVAALVSGFSSRGGAITGMLLLVWVALEVRLVLSTGRWPRFPLSGWMLGFLVWLGVAVFWSSSPNVSWLTAWMLAGLPITYLAWGMTPSPERLWRALRTVLLLFGSGLALWGLGQVVTGFGNGQPVGPLVDKNAFAALMNLFWFVASVHLVGKVHGRGLHWRVIPVVLGLLLIATALFAAESRGATLAWLLLMPVFIWAIYQNTRNKHAIVAVLMIALTGYLIAANGLNLNVGNRTLNLEQDASTSARLQMWKSTAHIVLDHPIKGTGWGTFVAHYPAYRDPSENTTSGTLAHNDYLQLASEGGIPVLVLLLGILAGMLLQLQHSLASRQNPRVLEATGLLLAVFALFIHASLNFIFYYAFMNILAGLLAARAIQLLNPEGGGFLTLQWFAKIGHATQVMLAGLVALLLAGPLLLHLMAQSTLVGAQPGLVMLRSVWPTANAYTVAKFISAIRPSSGIAQEVMLQFSEEALKAFSKINMENGGFKRELLQETLDRYEFVRAQSANSPAYGVREARTLIQHHDVLDPGVALKRAREILTQNLRTDPFHVDSMITLSRLDVVEKQPLQARQLLITSTRHVLSRRDQQLLFVEVLRQRAAPKKITELDVIENKLRAVRSETETGKALKLPANFSEDIDRQLGAIAQIL
ncbi:MAG: O-antigen ligase family protein [Polynucleobacter sp.]|nr:O-antigen ligase family protein [Polynucleobacter sp.]